MEPVLLLKALILGVVEGLTEFLPISSTGHLILAGHLLGFTGTRAQVFTIVIQTGAMLAVLIAYRARLAAECSGFRRHPRARRFFLNLAIAFVPAGVLGAVFGSAIKEHLFRPMPVAIAFIAGGFVILATERNQRTARVGEVGAMSGSDALKVGLAQTLALIPGTSRSGATIIGGMLFGLSRLCATEFSFFLAIPTLFAASAYELWKERALLTTTDLGVWAVGFGGAFVSALLTVRWLLAFIATRDFRPFAWYRIAFGVVVLVTAWNGWIRWTPAS